MAHFSVKKNGSVLGENQQLGHLTGRITPILDLGHGIALELVCEFVCGHLVLLASKITKQGVYKSRGYSR